LVPVITRKTPSITSEGILIAAKRPSTAKKRTSKNKEPDYSKRRTAWINFWPENAFFSSNDGRFQYPSFVKDISYGNDGDIRYLL
jgi:hypothetical protein